MYRYENILLKQGFKRIAGCDEAGRGPLAGPIFCAAVILDEAQPIEGLNDSKQLTQSVRERLYQAILKHAKAYAIAEISTNEVDRYNVYQASRLGMIKALGELTVQPDYILTDAMPLIYEEVPARSIVKGDQKSASIAAASILAKVSRDRYMVNLDQKYPNYGFKQHKGYPTEAHLKALHQYGVTDAHRKSFKPIQRILMQPMQLDVEGKHGNNT